jgi:hypothetical protein
MEPDRQFDEKSDVATTAFGGHSLLQKGNKMVEVGMGPSILLNHRLKMKSKLQAIDIPAISS